LVELLTEHSGMPLDRDEIIRSLWGTESKATSHGLNVHMANLRKKLSGSCPEECIVSVGRIGRSGYLWALSVHMEQE
jgi:DNA-binding response OmpR family regulator